MDKNAQLYYESARALKLPLIKIPSIAGFKLKLGKYHYFFRGGETPFNQGSSISVATNKYCTNKVLEAAGFPVPKAVAFNQHAFQTNSIETLLKDLRYPLVVKPTLNSAAGRDVVCNIQTTEQLINYLSAYYQRHDFLSVEEFHPHLNAYRVLVFHNKVIGVTQRFPAHIVGDGVHSIKELITISNRTREALKYTTCLDPITLDDDFKSRFSELSITLETIPKKDEKIELCYKCNSVLGGTIHSLGTRICKENARLFISAAKALNLHLVGFDVQCEDILKPIISTKGVIIEANYNPGITIHDIPLSGIKNPVSKKMMKYFIYKHPIAYVSHLLKNCYRSCYFKFSLLAGVLLVYKSLT